MKRQFFLIVFTIALGITDLVYSNDIVEVFTNVSPPTTVKLDNGEITGFSVDVVRELMRRVDNQSEIKLVPWVRGYHYVMGKPNIAIFTGSRNASREKIHHWIIHLTTRRSVFYAKKGSEFSISSLEEAKKYTIGVLRNGNREKYLQERGFTKLQPVNTEEQNILKLLHNDRIDLIFQSAIEAASNLKRINRTFDEIEPKFTVFQNDSYLIMSQNGTPMETVNKWKEAAKKMKTDGSFVKIAQKWIDYIKTNYDLDTEVKNNVLMFFKD